MKPVTPGKFFVIEGIDGSGKTTVVKRLREAHPDFSFSREPGGTPLGEKIRTLLFSPDFATALPETQLLEFFAARAEHVAQISAWRKKGITVVCDRFDSASYAFQVAPRLNTPRGPLLHKLFQTLRRQIVEQPLCLPTAYIYLNLSPEEARRRKAAPGLEVTHFDRGPHSEYKARIAGFNKFADIFALPDGLWHTVDANGSPDVVFEHVDTLITKLLKKE